MCVCVCVCVCVCARDFTLNNLRRMICHNPPINQPANQLPYRSFSMIYYYY